MRTVTTLGLTLLLAACSTAPQAPQIDLAAVREAIESTNGRFLEAFNKGDWASLSSFYTEDAIVMPPNLEPAKGREAIIASMSAQVEQVKLTNLRLTTNNIDVYGDIAVELGNYSIDVQIAGIPITDQGKYVVIWKKQADGSWKLHRDIWNSSIPIPVPEEKTS